MSRTVFPYGLNDRVRSSGSNNESVGSIFPRLKREHQRSVRGRSRHHLQNPTTNKTIYQDINKNMKEFHKTSYNFIRKLLDKCKKKLLKSIALAIMNKSSPSVSDEVYYQTHRYILDIVETKIFTSSYKSLSKLPPENLCIVEFKNKAVEYIRLPSILKNKDVVSLLPENLQQPEKIPVVTYKLGPTIRSKVFNYKDAVTSALFQEDSLNDLLNIECNCRTSEFCDINHGHVITGNLSIVNNLKLRKVLSKGPNYREKRTINFNVAKREILNSICNLSEKLKNKYKLHNDSLNAWKDKITTLLSQKITNLKHSIHISHAKPFLNDPAVVRDLEKTTR